MAHTCVTRMFAVLCSAVFALAACSTESDLKDHGLNDASPLGGYQVLKKQLTDMGVKVDDKLAIEARSSQQFLQALGNAHQELAAEMRALREAAGNEYKVSLTLWRFSTDTSTVYHSNTFINQPSPSLSLVLGTDVGEDGMSSTTIVRAVKRQIKLAKMLASVKPERGQLHFDGSVFYKVSDAAFASLLERLADIKSDLDLQDTFDKVSFSKQHSAKRSATTLYVTVSNEGVQALAKLASRQATQR